MPGVRVEEHTKYGASLAPRLAGVGRFVDRQRSCFGGSGFRAPSAKELGFVSIIRIYGYRILGNKDLAPEKCGRERRLTVTPDKTISSAIPLHELGRRSDRHRPVARHHVERRRELHVHQLRAGTNGGRRGRRDFKRRFLRAESTTLTRGRATRE